jgi:hypothetical protein
MRFIVAAAALFASLAAHAGNYAECILDKMPGTANVQASFAVVRVCTSEYPTRYTSVLKGEGRGLFGFKNSEACIIKKSRDTVLPGAAFLISAACRCLYDEAFFEGQTCDQEFKPLQ